MKETVMEGVTEYCEGAPVKLLISGGRYESGVPEGQRLGRGRVVVSATNERGNNGTEVDLLELIAWLKKHRPDVLQKASEIGATGAVGMPNSGRVAGTADVYTDVLNQACSGIPTEFEGWNQRFRRVLQENGLALSRALPPQDKIKYPDDGSPYMAP